jgi:pimeloyl-ACP methyl ester carboxylesterase
MTAASIERQYVDSRFGQSHLYRAGPLEKSGHPPLMCFHMSPWAAVYYEPLLAEMGQDRLALAVDTPGFGNSDAPPSAPSIGDFAAAMGDVADGLGLKTFNVLGDHTGAKVALELARQRPDQVQRIIMLSLAVWTDEEIAHRSSEGPHAVPENGDHLVSSWASMVEMSMPERSLDRLGEIFYARHLHHKTAHWGHVAAAGYRAKDALGEVKQPIMILNPEDDLYRITPRAKQFLTHPESHIRDLPGWGYGFLEVKVAEVAALAREFLDPAA